jgi:hypothetical protein
VKKESRSSLPKVFSSPAGMENMPMHIPSTIRTTFGPAHVPVRATVRVTLTRRELFAAIRQIERDADEARARGKHEVATRLDWAQRTCGRRPDDARN